MPEYICEACNYNTKIKPHYNRHLQTNKHKKNIQFCTKIEPKIHPGPYPRHAVHQSTGSPVHMYTHAYNTVVLVHTL